MNDAVCGALCVAEKHITAPFSSLPWIRDNVEGKKRTGERSVPKKEENGSFMLADSSSNCCALQLLELYGCFCCDKLCALPSTGFM